MTPRRARLAACALVVAFAALAGVYSVTTPPWKAPDEVGHMLYVAQLATTGSLPIQRSGEHEPPLYYALAALVVRPVDREDRSGHYRFNRNLAWAGNGGTDVNVALHGDDERYPYRGEALALHLARCVSVVSGAVTVALTIAPLPSYCRRR